MRGRVGWGRLGGRVCVGLRVCLLPSPRSLPLPFPCSSLFAGLFGLFFLGGVVAGVLCVGVGVCRCRRQCGRGCRGGRGSGGCCALGSLCVGRPPGFRFPGRRSGGADGGWLAAVVAWRLRGWSRLMGSAWVAWPGVGVRVGVFMAWADGVVGSVGVAGLCGCRVCVRRRRNGLGWGTVGDAMGGGDAGDAYRGGCCRRRIGFVLLTWVLRVMRRATTGLVTLMVS